MNKDKFITRNDIKKIVIGDKAGSSGGEMYKMPISDIKPSMYPVFTYQISTNNLDVEEGFSEIVQIDRKTYAARVCVYKKGMLLGNKVGGNPKTHILHNNIILSKNGEVVINIDSNILSFTKKDKEESIIINPYEFIKYGVLLNPIPIMQRTNLGYGTMKIGNVVNKKSKNTELFEINMIVNSKDLERFRELINDFVKYVIM